MPDLPGRAVVPEVDPSVHGDDAADAGPDRHPDDGSRAASGAEPELGEAECPGVVDQ